MDNDNKEIEEFRGRGGRGRGWRGGGRRRRRRLPPRRRWLGSWWGNWGGPWYNDYVVPTPVYVATDNTNPPRDEPFYKNPQLWIVLFIIAVGVIIYLALRATPFRKRG